MLIFVKLLAPVLIGGVAAGAMTFGFVQVRSATPSENPANQQIITYGD